MPRALRLDVEPQLKDPVLLLAFDGWNDAGDAASDAVAFFEDALRAVPLGAIDGESYYDFTVRRPLVQHGAGGAREIVWPDYELRYAVLDDRIELVTGRGAEPHLHWRSFVADVLSLVEALGIRRVVLLGAYLADVLYSLPVAVTGFASRPERLEPLGVSASGYEGPTGIVGVLGQALMDRGIETVSLWAGLPHYITLSPNPRGTLALVQKTTQLLGLPVDQTPLEDAAADFEQRISKIIAEDPVLAEYIRELKKREFAQ
jgi:hypothetical protein